MSEQPQRDAKWSEKVGEGKLESSAFTKLPLTLAERLKKIDAEEYRKRSPDDWRFFDRNYNRKQIGFARDGPLWAAPVDARYRQIKMGRHCFDYYVDYYRCQNLLGEQHEPCRFFRNVFMDVCPSFWVEKFDEWREAGIFPAHFDR